MAKPEHLWAIGYHDMGRAEQVRDEIIRLGWDTHYLTLLDVAVVVHHPDGSFTCNREPFPAVANILGCTAVGFLLSYVPGGRNALYSLHHVHPLLLNVFQYDQYMASVKDYRACDKC